MEVIFGGCRGGGSVAAFTRTLEPNIHFMTSLFPEDTHVITCSPTSMATLKNVGGILEFTIYERMNRVYVQAHAGPCNTQDFR
jgi:hypothetical protein